MIWRVVVTTIAVVQWKELITADAIPGFGSSSFYSFAADAAMITAVAAEPDFPLVMAAIAAALSSFSFFLVAAVTAANDLIIGASLKTRCSFLVHFSC